MSGDTTDWTMSAQRLTDGAWRWLGDHYGEFALPDDVPAAELDLGRYLKPLGELILAGSIALREGSAGRTGSTVAADLVEFGWTQLRGGDALADILRARPLDTIPVETYAAFVRAGRRHTELSALLAHLATLAATRAPEHVPNRVLGVVNAERVVGLDTSWDVPALTARTWLGSRPEPWTADLSMLYALTHTVYHLTDWGARPAGLPACLQDYLHAWLPAWLEVYLEAGHWDVVAELLFVDVCLAAPGHHDQAWARLGAAQHPDGMLPAEAWRDARNPRTMTRNHYHSTVVAAMAGTLAISRRLDPHRT